MRFLVVALFIVIVTPQSLVQAQTTEPLSTLPTYVPAASPADGAPRPSCDICWKPEPRASSRLQQHRRPHRPGIHRQKRDRMMHGPRSRGLRSLPRYPLKSLSQGDTILSSWQIQVIDGDTFRYGNERIRVRGVNASELLEPGGLEASIRLENLLTQGEVRIISRGRDVYDRLVADVFVDGRNVAETLAEEGYAKNR